LKDTEFPELRKYCDKKELNLFKIKNCPMAGRMSENWVAEAESRGIWRHFKLVDDERGTNTSSQK
jgi:hypothetical protein